MRIDINCDLGEGMANDEALMSLISSANIACGYHAGDQTVMKKTVALALKHGVSIGAHPGLDDRENFGRIEKPLTYREVQQLVLDQVSSLQGIAAAEGANLQHVKPHGALYHMVNRSEDYALAFVEAVRQLNTELWLFTVHNSALYRVAEELGLPVACEVFVDRTYQDDGSLTPRSDDNALIVDPHHVSQRLISIIKENKVQSVNGKTVDIRADTVCLHGDTPEALMLAEKIRTVLQQHGVSVRGFLP